MLDYGESLTPSDPTVPPSFTPHPEANQFLLSDWFAFLLAVIFDQGMPAERAWQAPYGLRSRLGHLDPARIATDIEAVRAAVKGPPALHKYVEKVPLWIVGAAQLVLQEYQGDAGRI